MAKAGTLSTPPFHHHSPVQTRDMILCHPEYNTGLPWPSHLHHRQGHQDALRCRLQNFYLIQPRAVRIAHKTLAISVLTCFKNKVATKWLRNTSSARSVSNLDLYLGLKQAVLIQLWSVLACFLALLMRAGSHVQWTLMYSFCSFVTAGQQFYRIWNNQNQNGKRYK